MVAKVAPAGMPTREFSAMILGGAWPFTNPEDWQSVADAQHAKGVQLIAAAGNLRGEADRVAAEQSGATIDGYHERLYGEAARLTADADEWFSMSRASGEIARLFYGLQQDLDEIDREAHEEIERVRQSAESLGGQLMWQAIQAVVADARGKATTTDAAAAGAITKQGTQIIGIGATSRAPAPSSTSGDPVDPALRAQVAGFSGGGGGPGVPRNGMPTGLENIPKDRIAGGSEPSKDLPPGPGEKQRDGFGGDHAAKGTQDGKGTAGGSDTEQGDGDGGTPVGQKVDNDPPTPGETRRESFSNPTGLGNPSVMPAALSGGSGSTSLGSSGVGGLKPPSTGSAFGGLPSPLTQGLASSGSSPGAASLVPPTSLTPPAAGSSDFARGLSAGLGGAPAAPFAPPVAPMATSASAAPAGAVSSGPVAAAGGPAVSPPAPSPTPFVTPSPPPSAASAAAPAGPVGPLPPFGSDVPRSASGNSAAVSPAAGPPAASVSAGSGGSSAAPVAPLPPGVVGAGVGAAAGSASEGVRSSLPDPLLERASELVYQLMHASTVHGLFLDWCVGVFRTRSGAETVIVSSEGLGFIPRGVFVPRTARMLFAEPGLSSEFRARWFSWANPASTMVAFAGWVRDCVGAELWALAVSTEYGGSAVPAQTAGVPHFEECSSKSTPISPAEPAMPLDDTHMHRLETLDRSLFARLTGFGDGPLPDRSEAWRTTLAAAHTVLGRAGALPDLPVPAVIRDVLDLMAKGVPVPRDRWKALADARWDAVGMGSGLRPGRMLGDEAASPHVLAYHDLARLIELLLLWDLDSDADGPAIKHPEIAYLARQIENTPTRSSDAG